MTKLFKCISKRTKNITRATIQRQLVITEADKGGTVVILNEEDYIKEVKLNYNSATTNNDTVNKIIKRFHKENLISKNTVEGLKIESPKSHLFKTKTT